MKILVATSWGTACGIANHSQMAIAAIRQADPTLEFDPQVHALDPDRAHRDGAEILWLNYHRALHSRWTPERVVAVQRTMRVVITFHDTFGENPPDQLSQDLCDLADAFIVHEPCLELKKAAYWRMGVPQYNGACGLTGYYHAERPMVGTMGFDFPWKCWDQIAETAATVGWGMVICCPEITAARRDDLNRRNPWLTVHCGLDTQAVLAALHACDATAFTNVCGNSGQSAAILQGIGARKPVIAFSTCRQYRALLHDPLGAQAITWCETFEQVQLALRGELAFALGRFDPRIVALAEQDSWTHQGEKYAALFRGLA